MAIQVWTGADLANPTVWSAIQNWSGAAVPVAGDAVVIPGGTGTEPVLDASTANLSSLTINTNGTLTVPGAYTLNVAGTGAGAIDLTGTATLDVVGTIEDAGGIAVEGTAVLIANGDIVATGGIALAAGTTLWGSSGIVNAPVTATGTATIQAGGAFLGFNSTINGSNLVLSTVGSSSTLSLAGSGNSSSVQSVTLNGGTLELGSNDSLTVADAMAIGTGVVTVDGGSLNDTLGLTLGNGGAIIGLGFLNAPVLASGTATIEAINNEMLDVTGRITGPSALVLETDGPGSTLRLETAGSSAKTVTLNGGRLWLQGAGGLTVNSQMVVGDGTVGLTGGTLGDASGMTIGGGSIWGYGEMNTAVTVTGAATISTGGGTLEMAGPISNAGTLGLQIGGWGDDLLLDAASAATSATFSASGPPGTLELNTNGSLTLVNALAVGANTVQLDGPASTLTDAAGVTIGAGTISGVGVVAAPVTATGAATILATGGTLEMSGPITNNGTLALVVGGDAGDTLRLDAASAATSATFAGSAGTLELNTGGSLTLASALAVGTNTVQLDGPAAMLSDAAGVTIGAGTISGVGMVTAPLTATGPATILASGGTLELSSLTGPANLATAGAGDTLRLDSTTQAQSVTLAGGSTLLLGTSQSVLTVTDPIAIGTGTISGQGTINATVDASTNAGTIMATGGLLEMTGPVTGSGLVLGAAGGTLRLDAAGNTANALTFNGGVLWLGNPNTSLAVATTTTLGTGRMTGLGLFTGAVDDGTATGTIVASGGTLEMASPVTGSALILGTYLATDTLRLDAAGNTAGSLWLSSGGTLLLGSANATLAVGTTTALGTGTITGLGTFTGAVNDGTGAGNITADGGTLEVASTVTGSALVLATTTGADTLQLDAAGNTAKTVTLAGGGTLRLATNSGLTVATAMAIGAGTVSLASGATMTDANGVTLTGGTIAGEGGIAAASISGYGTVSANFAAGSDSVNASGGTLKITTNLAASGGPLFSVANSPQSILQFDGSVGSASTVAFIGTLGALELDDATSGALNFAATVYGLDVASGNTPNLSTINYINVQAPITRVAIADSTHLELYDGSTALGAITLGSAINTSNTFVDWRDDATMTGSVIGSGVDIYLDNQPLSVDSVTASGSGISNGNGDLATGATVLLTLAMSEAVTLDTSGGTPTLSLNDGGTATYQSGSGSNALVFTYTAAAGQHTTDLAVTGSSLNGATIVDGAGNPADLSGAVTDPTGALRINDARIADFTASGSSDILFQDPTTGALGDFLMNNGQPSWASIGSADPALQVVGVGDFNGDGTDDILLRDPTSGGISQFAMQDNQPTWEPLGWAAANWQVAGVGDFTGNGTSDILFRDPTTGVLGDFLMNNGQPTWQIIGSADPNLQVVGVGDFNGDGTDDILFRDPTSGVLGEFAMNNNQPTWETIGWAATNWQVAGIGDFTGSGTDDILFRDPTSGALGDFVMSNGQATWAGIGWADPSLQVVGVGDYNANGTDDILFRDPTSGGISEFAMQNNQATWSPIGHAATSWQVTG